VVVRGRAPATRRPRGAFARALAAAVGVLVAALGFSACGSSASPQGAGGCSGGAFQVGCDACVESACCAAAAACYLDPTCDACAQGAPLDGGTCATGASALWDRLLACIDTSCSAACVPASTCNPVTNAGCGAGEACDLDQDGAYTCFATANTTPTCAVCSNADGPFCDATSHCVEQGATHACARYCCDAADCGGSSCDLAIVPGGVGVCVSPIDGGLVPTACAAPPMAASGGACFKLPDAGAARAAPRAPRPFRVRGRG
jgi:hypothetical protein